MNKEYIEREAALRHKRKMSGTDFGGDFWDEAVLCEEIRKIPKANVVEVKYGRWVYYKKKGIAVCSGCSFERKLDDDFGKAISCPNCGARMDGDSNEKG